MDYKPTRLVTTDKAAVLELAARCVECPNEFVIRTQKVGDEYHVDAHEVVDEAGEEDA